MGPRRISGLRVSLSSESLWVSAPLALVLHIRSWSRVFLFEEKDSVVCWCEWEGLEGAVSPEEVSPGLGFEMKSPVTSTPLSLLQAWAARPEFSAPCPCPMLPHFPAMLLPLEL